MSEIRNSGPLKKIDVVLVICCLVMVSFVVNATAALDGSGTEQDPWRIQSLEDFNEFAVDANYWAGFTRLETDVNLAGMIYSRAVIAPDVNNANYDFDGTAFQGVFDGNDHEIINLSIDDGGAGNDYLGLFGCIDDGEVRYLGLEGGCVSGEYYIGSLVGENLGIVSNCYSTGNMSGYSNVGGLVGKNGFVVPFPTPSLKAGYIYNSYSAGSVQGDSFVGGLVGCVSIGDVSDCYSTGAVQGISRVGGLLGVNTGIVSNCYATGDIGGSHEVGGLVGENSLYACPPCYDPGYIHNSHSTGAVKGISRVGGLLGYNRGSSSNCYSSGSVSGDIDVGGLVGWNEFGDVSVCYSTGSVSGDIDVGGLLGYNSLGSASNCYSIGDVNGVRSVGGLLGYNWGGSNSNCYSTGSVSGTDNVGGLVGDNWKGSISNCFWDTDTQTHGVTDSIGQNDGDVNNVEGLPTIQMQAKSTFTDAGWDFINVWNIGENQTYPYLRIYLPSDINKDRITNLLDIAIICEEWLVEE